MSQMGLKPAVVLRSGQDLNVNVSASGPAGNHNATNQATACIKCVLPSPLVHCVMYRCSGVALHMQAWHQLAAKCQDYLQLQICHADKYNCC